MKYFIDYESIKNLWKKPKFQSVIILKIKVQNKYVKPMFFGR